MKTPLLKRNPQNIFIAASQVPFHRLTVFPVREEAYNLMWSKVLMTSKSFKENVSVINYQNVETITLKATRKTWLTIFLLILYKISSRLFPLPMKLFHFLIFKYKRCDLDVNIKQMWNAKQQKEHKEKLKAISCTTRRIS